MRHGWLSLNLCEAEALPEWQRLWRMKNKAQWAPGSGVRVLNVQRLDGKRLITAAGEESSVCPSCSVPSTTRHGHYSRQLQDLPKQGAVVMLRVQVTRWQCRNARCKRRTFSQLPLCIAAPMHGEPPVWQAWFSCSATPQVVGRPSASWHGWACLRVMIPSCDISNDWGWIKGCRYGTLIVDLE
jgi:zinc-finger of transposase IS204/IS1001/IS1096/IS1165